MKAENTGILFLASKPDRIRKEQIYKNQISSMCFIKRCYNGSDDGIARLLMIDITFNRNIDILKSQRVPFFFF